MTPQQAVQIAIYVVVPLALVRPLGGYLARAYKGERTLLGRLGGPLERLLCRLAGVPAGPGPLVREAEMTWQRYVLCLLAWNGVGVIFSQALKFLPGQLPLTQNFVAATTGLAVLTVVVRGLARPSGQTVGNFWVDLIRGTLYILLPLAVLVALLRGSQGIILTLAASRFKGA